MINLASASLYKHPTTPPPHHFHSRNQLSPNEHSSTPCHVDKRGTTNTYKQVLFSIAIVISITLQKLQEHCIENCSGIGARIVVALQQELQLALDQNCSRNWTRIAIVLEQLALIYYYSHCPSIAKPIPTTLVYLITLNNKYNILICQKC